MHIDRTVSDIGVHDICVAPAFILGVDVIRPVVPEHLPAPGERFIAFRGAHHKAQLSHAQARKVGIQFACFPGFYVMVIAGDRLGDVRRLRFTVFKSHG